MPACEHCWNEAFLIAKRTGEQQADVYRRLIEARPALHPVAEEENHGRL